MQSFSNCVDSNLATEIDCVVQVNIARVYNHDVRERRKGGEAAQ